jgi:hypothetical protein
MDDSFSLGHFVLLSTSTQLENSWIGTIVPFKCVISLPRVALLIVAIVLCIVSASEAQTTGLFGLLPKAPQSKIRHATLPWSCVWCFPKVRPPQILRHAPHHSPHQKFATPAASKSSASTLRQRRRRKNLLVAATGNWRFLSSLLWVRRSCAWVWGRH